MEGEEKTLYAKLRTEVYDEGAAEIANNADYEHQEIKDLLKMVDEQETGSEDWNELLQSLKESVMSHVQFEETQLFSEVKEDFSRDEQINIGTQFEELRVMLLSIRKKHDKVLFLQFHRFDNDCIHRNIRVS